MLYWLVFVLISLLFILPLERFSTECRNYKTKTKRDVDNTMNQSKLKANTCNRRQARENAFGQGTIGFGLASHWFSVKWREICQPITEHSKANLKQTQKYFRHSIVNCSNAYACTFVASENLPVPCAVGKQSHNHTKKLLSIIVISFCCKPLK